MKLSFELLEEFLVEVRDEFPVELLPEFRVQLLPEFPPGQTLYTIEMYILDGTSNQILCETPRAIPDGVARGICRRTSGGVPDGTSRRITGGTPTEIFFGTPLQESRVELLSDEIFSTISFSKFDKNSL